MHCQFMFVLSQKYAGQIFLITKLKSQLLLAKNVAGSRKNFSVII